MIEFEWLWIFFLLPLPLLARSVLPRIKEIQQAALRVPFLEDFSEQSSTRQAKTQRSVFLLCISIIWLLLVLAAARPQWIGETVDLPLSGRDLMLAVDLSTSMREQDFFYSNRRISRMDATKIVAGDFIERRKGDRIGLILFGERAYTQTPLTFDLKTVKTLLYEAVTGLAGRSTAIGDAIGLAVKRLQANPDNQRVLILITDGVNTAGELDPVTASELAQKTGLKIYTIGVGNEDFYGRSPMDEKSLKHIAAKTGGQYFRARNTAQLEEIYALLDQLEPLEQDTQSFRPTRALFYWPLGLALLLTLALTVIRLGKSES